MVNVTFMPANITVSVNAGELLLDAANKAGVSVETPCGGKGTCGKCLVKIVSGEVDFDGGMEVSPEMRRQGWGLICRARVGETPVVVNTFYDADAEQGRFPDHAGDFSAVDPSLMPKSGDYDLIVKRALLTVAAPKAGDGLSDYDRLKAAAVKELSCRDIRIALPTLAGLPQVLRQSDGEITLLYAVFGDILHIVDITAGRHAHPYYGLAIDIGTTTVAISLVADDGRIIGGKTGYNAQVACGLDIISRINYAKTPERLSELRTKVLGTINGIVKSLCTRCGICPSQICNASVAANTVMVHLLLGVIPEYIRLDPYTPAVYRAPFFTAGELGIHIQPNAPVYIAPSVGSYVGGDITSGILCTSLATRSDELCLFIDIGTNGEIILGNADFLLGCACSAGPAFEGGGIRRGMRASAGAIERVAVDSATGKPLCTVIGNVKPKGICGSGMISLIAGLFKNGFIDPSGRLQGRQSDYITDAGYMLTDGDASENGHPIIISETDIDNIVRAKAAIFSGCRTLLASVGMDFCDLSRIYIAGGFGRYLDVADAKTIGLIPNLPEEKFVFLGNSSLTGAYMTLMSSKSRRTQSELAQKITYLDLSAEPSYMDQYTAALFLPHTDRELFS